MPASDPTIEARRFIAEHITSVAQLEMLLLLRTSPDDAHSADELARELRVDPAWARAELRSLCDRGLLERQSHPEEHYCFRPRTGELDRAVTALARAYLVHRVSIIEAIYSKPSDGISRFADAFRLKKRPPNG